MWIRLEQKETKKEVPYVVVKQGIREIVVPLRQLELFWSKR